MKKFLLASAIFTCIMILVSAPVFADGIPKNINVYMNSATIKIDGVMANIPDINYQSTLYIPLKDFVQLLGKKVLWDEQTKSVNIVDDPDAAQQISDVPSLAGVIKCTLKILSTSFLLAGMILMAQMILLRRRNDIAFLAKFTSPSNKSFSGARRLLYETWLSRTGFYYLFAGLLLSFIIRDAYKIDMLLNLMATAAAVLILLIIGWWMCRDKTSKQYPEILKLGRNTPA